MKIKLLAMDVDGTMTDGKIYIGANGEAMKAFSVKDGYGIAELRKSGVKTAIITARNSEIVERRAIELSIDKVLQGVKDKKNALEMLAKEYGLEKAEIAYIGDDIPDIPAMEYAGLVFCPKDASPEIKIISNIITASEGGKGAIRDAAEYILKNNKHE